MQAERRGAPVDVKCSSLRKEACTGDWLSTLSPVRASLYKDASANLICIVIEALSLVHDTSTPIRITYQML